MKTAEELIASAGALSLAISKSCNEISELSMYIEFFGLMRHNLEIIRHRRIAEASSANKIKPKTPLRPIYKRRIPLRRMFTFRR